MTPLSLREWLLVKFRLASPALQARALDAAWRGERPSALVQAAQGFLAAALVLLPSTALAWLCMPGVALLEGAPVFTAAADRLRSGNLGGTPLPVSGITRMEIQRQHDRWHAAFGDDPYREDLKPRALGKALDAYMSEVARGNFSISPEQWMSRLSPEDIRRFVRQAEAESPVSTVVRRKERIPDFREFPLDGTGGESSFRMIGQPDRGQARIAPAISETHPEE